MTTKYPTLEQMGVTSFDNISRYSLRREARADVLKIYYRRPSGSLLSRSKKFTYARAKARVAVEFQKTEAWHQLEDTSPLLRQAVAELQQLLKPAAETAISDELQNTKQQLLADLEHMEAVLKAKLEELRHQIEALQ